MIIDCFYYDNCFCNFLGSNIDVMEDKGRIMLLLFYWIFVIEVSKV